MTGAYRGFVAPRVYASRAAAEGSIPGSGDTQLHVYEAGDAVEYTRDDTGLSTDLIMADNSRWRREATPDVAVAVALAAQAAADAASAAVAALAILPEQVGAAADGVTSDNAAFTAAAALVKPIKTSASEYLTTLGLTALPKAIDGDGTVRFGVGGVNKLAKSWRNIDTPASAVGDESGFGTAFNGDWSRTFPPRAVQVSGAATLGQPTTGFFHNIESIPYYLYMRNVDSGHNESLTGNEGRTTWPGFRIRGFHSGQGGMMGFSSSIFVNGAARPGVTSFLANPAAANISASGYAGANGVYLNPLELNCQDQGFDVAAIGPVINMQRTNKTGGMDAFWGGCRIQSIGSEAINSGYQISGKADTGLDFTKADFSSGAEAAIALQAGHRIYFEALSANNWHKTANGDTWLTYNAANSGLEMFVNGSEVIRARTTGVLIRNTSLQIETGNVALQAAGSIVSIGGVKVLGQRQAAIASAAAGTEVATINSILAAMRTHGLIAT